MQRSLKHGLSLLMVTAFLMLPAYPAQAKMRPRPVIMEMDRIAQSDEFTKDQKFERLEAYLDQQPELYAGVLYRLAKVDDRKTKQVALQRFRSAKTTRVQKYVLGGFLLRSGAEETITDSATHPDFIREYGEFLVNAVLDGGREEFCVVKTNERTAVGEYVGLAGGIGGPPEVAFSVVADRRTVPILIQCLSAPDHVYPQAQGCIRMGEPGESSGRNVQRQGIPLAVAKLGAVEAVPELRRIVQKHHDYWLRANSAYALGRLSDSRNTWKLEKVVKKTKEPSFLFHFGKGLMDQGNGQGIRYLDFRYSEYSNQVDMGSVLYMTGQRLEILKGWKDERTKDFYEQALEYKPLLNVFLYDPENIEIARWNAERDKEEMLNALEGRILAIMKSSCLGSCLTICRNWRL